MGKPKINVNVKICLACGGCISICPKDALSMKGAKAKVDENKCIICGICAKTCPIAAISEVIE
jgi:ferredoxin